MNHAKEYILHNSSLIEQRLDTLVIEKNVPYNRLYQAARYSLLSGGKRMRPLLTLVTAETLGSPLSHALDPACALEMLHTYSLIHDDLPCMDNDNFRRGKPSLHRAFPEGHAVLTGDFLLTYAFEVISHAPHITSQQKLEMIQLLAKNSGAEGMIGGQIMDIESDGKSIDLPFLQDIHERKTGALIATAIEFGAIIANTSQAHKEILKQIGYEIGFAFQVIDDVIDVTSNKNSDKKNGKSTYATLLGVEKARSLAHTHYESAMKKLIALPFNTTQLSKFAELLINRNQ